MRPQQGTISKGVDWSLFWILLGLSVIGMLAIFAATYREGDPIIASWIGFKTDYSKQFYFFLLSVLLGVCSLFSFFHFKL